MVVAAMKLKDTYSLEGKFDQLRQHVKKQRYYFVNYFVHLVKAMYGHESWTVRKAEC